MGFIDVSGGLRVTERTDTVKEGPADNLVIEGNLIAIVIHYP